MVVSAEPVEREMTFALIRAGLPNSIVVLALAALPIVALALPPAPHRTLTPIQSADVTALAAGQPAARGDRAVPD